MEIWSRLGTEAVMEQSGRGERILRAAGELLVAWGYRRVTTDEIARRAGVGKGTVYLHWKTKDALLLAVLLDSKNAALQRQLERQRECPLEVLPSRMARGYFRDFLTSPVLRALHTDDTNVLGRLNDIAATELAELTAHTNRALLDHLEILRTHGLVRDDLATTDQLHTFTAVLSGFFTTEVLLDGRVPETTGSRADLLARTLRAALETPAGSAADPGDLPGVRSAAALAAPAVTALYERIAQLSAEEMRRRLRD
ncbi:TetR/AcrR family transcriptional regulator [Streptomyces sp. BBFR2]|uniref:TetR/AcrR family transcriptional regulator n=1 Tax=Streptomyces sp. BBFR2 TaxID=3372854 RepID=UPI0037DA3CCE